MTEQRHPLRCETCKKTACEYYKYKGQSQTSSKYPDEFLASPSVITSWVGCASHSSHPAPTAPAKEHCINSCPCTVAKCPEEKRCSYLQQHDATIRKDERERVMGEMVKLSMMIETNETERWESAGRPKNDGYINGSHSGYGHALRDMRQWIDKIKKAESLRRPKDSPEPRASDIRKAVIYELLKDLGYGCPGGEATPICEMCKANQYCTELRREGAP